MDYLPYPSRQGFPTRIRPNPVESLVPEFDSTKIDSLSYADAHKLMLRMESININFKQTFRSRVITESSIQQQVYYAGPEDPPNPCFPCYVDGFPVLCPRGLAWDIQTKQLTLEVDSTFIPFGVQILSADGPLIGSYIGTEADGRIPVENGTYGGGFPQEDLAYYGSAGNVWDPIPNDFSRWWFKRFSPKKVGAAMRTEYPDTLLDVVFDKRTDTFVTQYGNKNEFLKDGLTYKAETSTGLIRLPIGPYDTPTFDSSYTFNQICECTNPGSGGPYYFQNPQFGVLNFFSTGYVDFYTEKDMSFLGNVADADTFVSKKYFVVFSTPVFTKQWVPAYTYRTMAGNGAYVNCSDYTSYSYPNTAPFLTVAPTSYDQVEIDDSGGTKTLPMTSGVKLYAVVSNFKPEYVGANLTEFFGGSILLGGTYHSYKITFPSGTALSNLDLWVHTYREPKVLPDTLMWREAAPTEENPCNQIEHTQYVPNDEFDEPEITVTLKFQLWSGKYDIDTGAWVQN